MMPTQHSRDEACLVRAAMMPIPCRDEARLVRAAMMPIPCRDEARLVRMWPMLLALLVLFIAATTAHAQVDPATITDDEVNAVAEQMFCTECENIPLDVCGTQACIQWREEIRVQLADGRTPEEILEYFRVNHGERALAIPQDPVLRGLTVYIPYMAGAVVLLLAGAFLLGWMRRTPDTPEPEPAPPVPENDYLAQLERDLKDAP